MRRRLVVVILWAALAVPTLAACGATSPGPADLGNPAAFATSLFDQANARRASLGLPALTWSDCLATKALPRAKNTLVETTLTHETLVATCEPGVRAGENLSRSARPAWEVVNAWMGSAGHRANILDTGFTTSGIACVAMAYNEPTRAARPGEDTAGMACSQLFEGGQ